MKVGVDLVQISEFQARLSEAGGLEKIFLDSEREHTKSPESLAGAFAAKEAFMKALGRKVDWLDVWVEKDKWGRPKLISKLTQNEEVEVSISHSGDYAVAVVVIS